MPWIADVVPQTTIRSVWGNSIRDRTVHQFASKAERDAVAATVFADGMMCYTAAESTWWLRRGGAWWPWFTPFRNFAPRAWANDGSNWWPVSGGVSVTEYQYTRSLDLVHVEATFFVNWGGGNAFIAFSIPFDPYSFNVKALGSGWLHDTISGVDRGGVMSFPGPIGGYPVGQITPNGQVTGPAGTGTVYFVADYRTNDIREVSPYG